MDTDPSDKSDSQTPQQQISAPLPQIDISEILGLLEVISSKEGGREDIYKLAGELQMEFGDTMTVIRAAELLGLVTTPGGDVEIVPIGQKTCDASINERKELIYDQLVKIPFFASLRNYLEQQEDQEVTRDDVLEKLAELIPNEDVEETFQTVVIWGRYAELFGYNNDTETFYLDTEEEEEPENPPN